VMLQWIVPMIQDILLKFRIVLEIVDSRCNRNNSISCN
jgi:hypothetical protein